MRLCIRWASRNYICKLATWRAEVAHVADDITGLQVPQGPDKLGHCPVKITLAVKIVTVTAMDIRNHSLSDALRLCQADGEGEQISSVQYLELRYRRMLVKSREFAVRSEDEYTTPLVNHFVHTVAKCSRVGDELILQIKDGDFSYLGGNGC